MKNIYQKYRELQRIVILMVIVLFLEFIFLGMNIELRDKEIRKLRVEKEDLKEQIYLLERSKE